MTQSQALREELEEKLDAVEEALETIDCDEAYVLFIQMRYRIYELVRITLYLKEQIG